MRKGIWSLNTQIVLLLTLVLIVPLASISLAIFSTIQQDLRNIGERQIKDISTSSISLIESFGNNLLGSVATNAQWEDFRTAAKNKDLQWIEENINIVKDVVPNVHFVITTDLDGHVLSKTDDVQGLETALPSDLLSLFKQNGKLYGLIPTQNGLALIATSKITDEDAKAESTGYVTFGRYLDANLLGDIKNILKTDLAVQSMNGKLLTTSPEINKEQLESYMHQNSDNKDGQVAMKKIGEQYISEMYSSIRGLKGEALGVLLVTQPLAAITNVEGNLTTMGIRAGLITLLAILILVFIMRRRINRPLSVLESIVVKVADGDLRSVVPERIRKRKDEIGWIGQSFQQMIEKLRGTLESLSLVANDTAVKVTSSASELSLNADETSSSTQNMALSAMELSEGINKVQEESNHSITLMQQMKQSIHLIHTKSIEVGDTSTNTLNTANQGGLVVNKAIDQMNQVNRSFGDLSKYIDRVGDSSTQVENIIELISNVASQTNLLALNAAIEAARAGENGKGFAVVADEVRKLAEQTAQSTEQVKSLIVSMRDNVSSSMEAMNQANDEVTHGISAFQEAGELFENIVAHIGSIHDQVVNVSVISKEITVSSESVLNSVQNTASFANLSSERTKETARNAQVQLATMEEIAASAENLESMANELQSTLQSLKL